MNEETLEQVLGQRDELIAVLTEVMAASDNIATPIAGDTLEAALEALTRCDKADRAARAVLAKYQGGSDDQIV